MAKLRIVFDRNKCIGAYSCVAEDPEKWRPADDGKVDLEGSRKNSSSIFTMDISQADAEKARAAAAVCPAAAIEVTEEAD